jgi:hypothetical protein
VLIAAGRTWSILTTTTDIYDPTTNSFSIGGNLNVGRISHTATKLSDGKVLVVWGTDGVWNYLNSAELYDPATNTWTLLINTLTDGIYDMSSILLENNKVLIYWWVKKVFGSAAPTNTYEIYDHATTTFTQYTWTVKRYRAALLEIPTSTTKLSRLVADENSRSWSNTMTLTGDWEQMPTEDMTLTDWQAEAVVDITELQVGSRSNLISEWEYSKNIYKDKTDNIMLRYMDQWTRQINNVNASVGVPA